MNKRIMRPLFTAVVVLTVIFSLWHGGTRGRGYSGTKFLFDTECSVTAYGHGAKEAVAAAFDRLAEVHEATNMYSEKSDVYRINNASAGEEIKVEPCTAEILETARKVAEDSEGAFDITIAAVTELWDFKSENPSPPCESDIKEALTHVGYTELTVVGEKCIAVKKSNETKVDLGGAAKGYAGDEVMRIMREYGVDAAIADLGGNVICMGRNPNSKDGKWRIGIQTPFAPTGEYAETVEIEGGAVVTSGTYQRYFEFNGRRYHHIIDPSTGYPAEHDYSGVTVVCEKSCLADCLATACFAAGRDKGKALAEKYGAEILFCSE